MQQWCVRIVESKWFERFIVSLIVFNGILIGVETSAEVMARHGDALHMANHVILAVFVIEAALKMAAVAPRLRLYFGNGWNLFDFTVVVLSFIPASGEFAMVARLVRLLRVLRLVSTVPKLRLIVTTLVHSIPSMGHVVLLLGLIFYIYGVAGFHLFHNDDPERWGTLGTSLLTLFQVVTLEGWTDVMNHASEGHPFAWVYFLSFIVIGTFVVMNLFIAVIISNLEETRHVHLEELREVPTREQILQELETTREAIARLHRMIESGGGALHPHPAAEPEKRT